MSVKFFLALSPDPSPELGRGNTISGSPSLLKRGGQGGEFIQPSFSTEQDGIVI
jgi:hypothetical protein